jgi:hypothetical protein
VEVLLYIVEAMEPTARCLLEDTFCHWYTMLVGAAASAAVGARFVVVVMAVAAKALALRAHALLDEDLQ